MTVDREELERCIAELEAQTTDPVAGLFGPSSLSWRVDREAINFLCAGRAALLQLAHPYVAHAIDQHSDTRRDPLKRFRRTFAFVYTMIFGDMHEAFACARKVHRIHERIEGRITERVGAFAEGDRYEANDEEALYWVYATLHDSAAMAHSLVVRELTEDELDGYLIESHRFARLFGIPERLLHHRWRDFVAYNERMFAWVEVGGPAREMGRFLLRAPNPALRPVMRWYRMMTAGLLPEPVREGFGLPFGRADRLAFDASLATLRRTYRRLPHKLREVPAHAHARRRMSGKPGRDRWADFVERHFIDTGITAATQAAAAAERARRSA